MKFKNAILMIVVSLFLFGNIFLISGNNIDNQNTSHMMEPIHLQDNQNVNDGFMHDGFMGNLGFMPGGFYGFLIIILVILVLVLLVIYLIKKITEPVDKERKNLQKKENNEAEEDKERKNKEK